jgi:hypothetical protein
MLSHPMRYSHYLVCSMLTSYSPPLQTPSDMALLPRPLTGLISPSAPGGTILPIRLPECAVVYANVPQITLHVALRITLTESIVVEVTVAVAIPLLKEQE